LLQLPQCWGSFSSSTLQSTPLQQLNPGPHVGQLPPPEPEPLLELLPPEPLPELLPPELLELPPELLLDPLPEPLPELLPEPLPDPLLDPDSVEASSPPRTEVDPPHAQIPAAATVMKSTLLRARMIRLPFPAGLRWAARAPLSTFPSGTRRERGLRP
jgi:hypothetical protein